MGINRRKKIEVESTLPTQTIPNDNKVRDVDIRKKFIEIYKPKNIFNELGIGFGENRIDLASLEAHRFTGYEIKSEVDTLVRFENQCLRYNKVFEYLNIIIYGKHLAKLDTPKYKKIMEHWGIYIINGRKSNFRIDKIKEPTKNDNVKVYDLCHLLWYSEAFALVRKYAKEEYKALKGNHWNSKTLMYKALSMVLDIDTTRREIYSAIKNRDNFRKGIQL